MASHSPVRPAMTNNQGWPSSIHPSISIPSVQQGEGFTSPPTASQPPYHLPTPYLPSLSLPDPLRHDARDTPVAS